jgi:hypothetical protein
MGRPPNLETRLKCNTCRDFTQSIAPIVIKKEKGNRIHISAA